MLPELGTALGNRLGRTGSLVRRAQPAYAWWLRTAYGRRGLPWRVNGEPIRIDPAVRHLVPHEVERPLFEYLREHIKRGDTVLDIGAFVGAYAIFEAGWAGPEGRVVAFEPAPDSFAILERHVRMNDLAAPRVDARRLAVGASRGRVQLQTFDGEPYRNMVAGKPLSAVSSQLSAVTVDVVTLDEIRASLPHPPNWIRMDVQGLEFDVLRGARDLLRERGRALHIVAEMHPQHWPAYGINPKDAPDHLAELGLRARNVVAGEDPFGCDAHAILEPLLP